MSPWTPYALRGVLWYQGEENVEDGVAYEPKMRAFFNGWKESFENPDLRLRFVQLAPWGNPRVVALQMAQTAFAAEGVEAPARVRYLHSRPWFGSIRNEVDLPMGLFFAGTVSPTSPPRM